MLGTSSLAETPLAALGEKAQYARIVVGSASGMSRASSSAGFAPLVKGVAVATDTAHVNSSIFSATVIGTATGTGLPSALGVLNATVVEAPTATDSITVDPSDFSANVSASASATDVVLSSAVFIATLSDGALGVDTVTRRLLWEVINDSQSTTWTPISTSS